MCKIGDHFCREEERFIREALRAPPRLKDPMVVENNDAAVLLPATTTADTRQTDVTEDDEELGSTKIVNPFDTLYKMNFERREGRTIFLSRHGESEYNVTARIGGNPPLTSKGQRYAKALGSYINSLGNSS